MKSSRIVFSCLILISFALFIMSCNNFIDNKSEGKIFSIMTASDSNGSITPSVSVNESSDVTINFTANEGYDISSIEVDGEKVANAHSYTFNDIKTNHAISVNFELIKNLKAYKVSFRSDKIELPEYVEKIEKFVAGGGQNLAIKTDGSLIDWENYSINGPPTAPTGLLDIKSIALGGNCYLALKQEGTVVAWGDNKYGQAIVPTDLNHRISIAAGANHAIALKNDGTITAWGSNAGGVLNIPENAIDIIAIDVRANFTVALKNDGTIIAWGTDLIHNKIELPKNIPKAKAIAAGYEHILVQ